MGKATRWLRNLLGGKKENRTKEPTALPAGGDNRDKKRWSFGKLGRDSTDGSAAPATRPSPLEVEKAWIRSYYKDADIEQNKHAIAVAAATAAAADAAVAAAHAAVEVVRLTSHGRTKIMVRGGAERWAAVTIQTAFRSYLAKKALRALKALVKLQALVRGFLVRKQAAATLERMQSLVRAQASVRAQRSRCRVLPVREHSRFYPEVRPRRSLETRSEHTSSFHSRRMSASLDPANYNGSDESAKIVEIDPGRPRRRFVNPTTSDSTTDESYTYSSPLPPRLTIPDNSSEWNFTGDECRFSTAQSTPRFFNGVGVPLTPAKSFCGGGEYRSRRYSDHSDHPNYMAKTESFNAKVRWQSAPKQRPEPRKKASLSELVESRASLSGVRMMRSCSKAQEAVSFRNAVVERLDRSSELAGDGGFYDRDYYLQRRW